MPGFRGHSQYQQKYGRAYAGVAGADLENAPTGPVPFTSPFGLPVGRPQIWRQVVNQPGSNTGGVPGNIVQDVSGNPSVASTANQVVQSPYGGGSVGRAVQQTTVDVAPGPGPVAGGTVGQPDNTYVGGLPQFGARVLQQGQESAVRAPGNAPVGYSNDRLTTNDRHGMMKVGYENSGRDSGVTDPPMDGPARPSLFLINRSINYQAGTDTTAATDDLSRDYTRNAEGMYVGEQGTGWSRVYGGVPGLWIEYGSYSGVSPDSPPVAGDTSTGIHSPTAEGQPGDGPHTLWGGPPHGLHSPTLPDYSQTIGRYMAIPQMARPRVDRPSNSPIAGQSYSQTVQSQGQSGFNQAQQPMSRGNFGVGWRGRAAGG